MSGKGNRVELNQVGALTFVAGKSTRAGRTDAQPQLQCIAGGACGEANRFVRAVQCQYMGHDGLSEQWRCEAELPAHLRLGSVTVDCEGYSGPDDPAVLAGSCALLYELDYTDGRSSSYSARGSGSSAMGAGLGTLLLLFGALAVLFYILVRGSRGTLQDGGYRNDAGGGPFPPGQYSSPFMAAPSTGMMGRGSGPGFWSGAALGGLAGYWAGGRRGYHTGYGSSYPSSSSSWFGSSSASSSSSSGASSSRTSTGFGGTRRR